MESSTIAVVLGCVQRWAQSRTSAPVLRRHMQLANVLRSAIIRRRLYRDAVTAQDALLYPKRRRIGMVDFRKSIAPVGASRRPCASRLSLQLLICATMATPSCGGDSPESKTTNSSGAAGRADSSVTLGGARESNNSESGGSSGAAGVDLGGALVESSRLVNAAGYGGATTLTGGIADAAGAVDPSSQLGGFGNNSGPGGATSLSGGTVNSTTTGAGGFAQMGGVANST